MYLDGGGLADHLREKLPRQVIQFLKDVPRDAHYLSSLINWTVNDTFYKLHYNAKAYINEKLRHSVAHASKVACIKIAPGQIVLCVHKNEYGVKTYTEHLAGKCPHVLEILNEYNRLQEKKRNG